MNWTIPGTTLTAPRANADQVADMFQSMFLPGGMVLSQVASITGLESYTVQNWVKRGFLAPPVNKRYNMEQLCRIIMINMLKGVLPLEEVCHLLSYINGDLADESDDLIDDTLLYFMFVKLAARARHIGGDQSWQDALLEATADYVEPVPGARQRVIQVLHVMLMAWIASRFVQQVHSMAAELGKEEVK